jgi:hypothetical protein
MRTFKTADASNIWRMNTGTGVVDFIPEPNGPVFPFPQPEVLDTAALTALCKNYERRILDLEKQVAELRALLNKKGT